MTRKRFIKLLMSQGVSRNNAVTIAYCWNLRGVPYERAYRNFLLNHSVKKAFSRLGEAICKVGVSQKELSKSLLKLSTEMAGEE